MYKFASQLRNKTGKVDEKSVIREVLKKLEYIIIIHIFTLLYV